MNGLILQPLITTIINNEKGKKKGRDDVVVRENNIFYCN